jgi:hypothetical protein
MARSYVAARQSWVPQEAIQNRLVTDQLVAMQFEPGRPDPNMPSDYKPIQDAPFMGRLAKVVIPIMKFPVKTISPKVYKRTEAGSYQIPLLSWESLFRMVSAVYFNAGKKGKVLAFSKLSSQQRSERIDISTKVKLRVLLALSPKSGL